jgi:hypothetical protein
MKSLLIIIIYNQEAKRKFPYNDKYFNVKVDNEGFVILGEGVCSVINDCSNAWKLLRENETLVDEPNDPSKCYDTYEYNAKAIGSGIIILIIFIITFLYNYLSDIQDTKFLL